jgi:acetolactate synthase-1/2/3 large subunit
MKNMTGAEAAVATLEANGIDTIFGIPGGHSLDIYDALSKSRSLTHILGRHEQGLAYMADGYSRSSGEIGVVTTTSGPAVANLACAMGQATTDTSSVLAISSTVSSDILGKNKGGLHDLNEAIKIMRPVCRYVKRCESPEEIPGAINGLIHSLKSGRPGGAYCEIPCDFLSARRDFTIDKAEPVTRPAIDASQIAQACELLASAKRPVIWPGTGVLASGAMAQLQQLSEMTQALIVPTSLGQGVMPADAPNVINNDGALFTEVLELMARADVFLAVGTMFKQEDTASWQMNITGKLIHIDIDAAEIGRSYQPDLGIVADAGEALQAILDNLQSCESTEPDWIDRGKAAQEARFAKRRKNSPLEMEALDVLRASVPRDGIVAADRCNLGYWAYRCLEVYEPRTFQYPMGYGGLGGSLPQAIGSKLVCPEKTVVCVIGDGGLQFTAGELAVAVQEKVAITIILCNNQGYGAILAGQKKNFEGLEFGVNFENPDFQQIAKAYGISSCTASDVPEFRKSLDAAIASEKLSLIELTIPINDP